MHFNLRSGNSLIGYVKPEKEKSKPITIFDFIKEEKADYIVEKIKVVAELKPYLEKTAKNLKIDGDIVREIETLNEILSKKSIDWDDFEKVLRTKEKLTRILIASLNSQYAVPLNNLLREITDLFNQKLDEKFAKDHNIKLEDLKKIKTFHWFFEFPEVFLNRGGFDVIVGNPPYGGNIHEKEKEFAKQKCDISKGNIAKAFILRGYDLTRIGNYLSFLSPKSLTYASDWLNLRKYLIEELLEIYDVKEAFKDVLLEQVFFVIKLGSKKEYYLAKDFFRKEEPLIKINKGKIGDTLLCDLSVKEYELIERIEGKFKLGELVRIWRGLPIQKLLSDEGEEEVIRGKDIGLYSLKRELPKIGTKSFPKKIKTNIEKFRVPKLMFQNIVAFISKPVPHIRVMGTLDDVGRLTLDTVNNIILKKKGISLQFLLALMNSLFFSWLLHRIAFNKAVRTMHLDNYALNKIPIPSLNKGIVKRIEKLVKEILNGDFNSETYFAIENEILRLYGINEKDCPRDYAIIKEHYKQLWEQYR